jgi:porphobilinogen deaminase
MATIIVAVQTSSMAKMQVEEVHAEIIKFHPNVHFKLLPIEASLQKKMDEALLKRRCNMAIHSAKDLSSSLDEELTIAAITQGDLAIVVRSDAHAMIKLFACIDTRQLQLQ